MLAVTLNQFLGPMERNQAAAAEPSATGSDRPPLDPNLGDTKPVPARAWDSSRDLPPQIASDKSVAYDYPIVYVRVPRPYPKEYYNINHLTQAGLHQTNAPGAELRILYPDGRDESLVSVAERESIADPMVSFDGQTVFFAKYHHMNTGATASMTQLQSREGADIYKIHVPTRKLIQITTQERTPNTGAVPAGTESHRRGVHNLGPCPVPGGKVVFVSDRNGYRGVRDETEPALQLFVMDDDGSNVEHIGHLNLGAALHPVMLKDGRVMFSSLETQGLRSDERWGIWAIRPDGTHWEPLTSALGSPPGQAVHFQAQLADESIVVESYYQTGSTDGFGTFWKFPVRPAAGYASFAPGLKQFAPQGLVNLTLFANFADVRPNHSAGNVDNRPFMGNVTHPAAAPDNHMLLVWSLPWEAQDQSLKVYDAGIYLLPSGRAINHPAKMLLIKNDPKFQELWPRALVPYRRIFGVDEPPRFVRQNDGQASPQLPAGTPFGLVGTSSLYKRESYPAGVVPAGSVTAVSARPSDLKHVWRELSVSRFSHPSNWGEQGGEAGLYENGDIWGIRIVALEPVSDAVFQKQRHYALVSNSEERLRILGEFPVRKFQGDQQPQDPDGNPDTSFLAKLPADVAWTFQTLDQNGMVLNMAQTWHQLRPGEIRNDCGGCQGAAQASSLDFATSSLTAAAKPDYPVWDLTKDAPLFTTKAHDKSGRKWDKDDRTGVKSAGKAVADVEFNRDIKPILDRSCVACHTTQSDEPAGHLALDDASPIKKQSLVPWAENVRVRQGLPRNYARLVQYCWAFQSRRSPLIWKIYGQRLDGFANDDIASPAIDYDNEQNVLDWCHHSKRFERDVDFTGSAMPPAKAIAGTFEGPQGQPIKVPPLSDEDKLALVRWIDIGCPIDLDYDPSNPDRRGQGWMLDEGRPTLTLAYPGPGQNAEPITSLLIGMHDYGTGLDLDSLRVTADFPIDGIAAGENLASRFESLGDSRWSLSLKNPIAKLLAGKLTVSIKDREGNLSKIERTFSIK